MRTATVFRSERDQYIPEKIDPSDFYSEFVSKILQHAYFQINRYPENQRSAFRSFSKSLVVALIKYAGTDRILHIEPQVELDVLYAEIFDGNMRKKITIPMIESVSEIIQKEKEKCGMPLDASVCFTGAALDVSVCLKNELNKVYNNLGLADFKRYASYRSDKEVLLSQEQFWFTIRGSRTIELLRFILLSRMYYGKTPKLDAWISKVKNGDCADFFDLGVDAAGFDFVVEYLQKENTLDEQRDSYLDLRKKNPVLEHHKWYDADGTVDYLKFILQQRKVGNPNFATNLFTTEFLEYVIGMFSTRNMDDAN